MARVRPARRFLYHAVDVKCNDARICVRLQHAAKVDQVGLQMDATCDRPARHRRLHDRFAATASQFATHVADHEETCRHQLELLDHILAHMAQASAAGRAGVGLRLIFALVARQVLWQRLAGRLVARRIVHRLAPVYAFEQHRQLGLR